MNPKFDLNDPKIKTIISIYSNQMKHALTAPQRVEDAVLPIYWVSKSGIKPEQIASGVVVQIKQDYFVFTASHVFDDMGSYQLLIGIGFGNKLISLTGDRFSSAKGLSGTHVDDSIDASVFHIQSEVPSEIKRVALSLDDLDYSQPDNMRSIHMAAGFRVKNSNISGNQATTIRESFPSIEYGENEYSILNLDIKTHIALAYDNKVLMHGQWQTSPKPKGMSGGAIIKVEGVTLSPPFVVAPQVKQLLSAITIEQRREKSGKPGVLIGTRIGVHLGLIQNYLPNLLDNH
jgi:hypothetical protein